MNRQFLCKNQNSKKANIHASSDILQRRLIGRGNSERPSDVRQPSTQQIDYIGFHGTEKTFNHDFSRIPVRLNSLFPIQAKLKIGAPNDKYEQEADRVADQVMRMPATDPASASKELSSNNSSKSSSGTIQRTCSSCANEYKAAEDEEMIQTKTNGVSLPSVTPVISSGISALSGGGQPLSGAERSFFEPRLGADFSRVRVHKDSRAANLARSVHARAFTYGNNVVFGAGEYGSDSVSGKTLLAHELVHVVQQGGRLNHLSLGKERTHEKNKVKNRINTIQRKEEPKPESAITLKNIIPFNKGDRVTLNHLISADIISALKFAASFIDSLDEKTIHEASALLPDLVKRTGTLQSITDDNAVLVIDKKAETKGAKDKVDKKDQKKKEGIDISGAFVIELKRDTENQTINIILYRGLGESKELLGEKSGIKVSRIDNGVKLSTSIEGTSIGIGITSDKSGKNLTVALSNPISAEALSITRLPKVREGSTEEKAAVSKAASNASQSRAFKPYRFKGQIGGNFTSKGPPSFLLGSSFQVNFRPIKQAGLFFHVPLELQLQYAPPSSVLAAINSGANFSLEQIVPINIRLITGIGGGTTLDKSSGERADVFGPTLGAGLDVKVVDSFSIGIRYQHLFNLVGDKVDPNIITFGISGRFGTKNE